MFNFKNKKILIGVLIISIMLLIAILAPVISPNDPFKVDLYEKFSEPNKQFPLGTDNLGRCLLSRLIFGTRYTLYYSLLILLISLIIGVVVGSISGYIGGRVDTIINMFINMFLSLPSFLVALAIAGLLGASSENMVMSIGLLWWSGYARFSRMLSIQIKSREYINVAILSGCNHFQIIYKHIIKNMLPDIIVLATLELGSIILSITTFSFIGLGVQPPIPEWGVMINDGKMYFQTNPKLIVLPSFLIWITVMGFNLLGKGLKNELENR